MCELCEEGEQESTTHVFITCTATRSTWNLFNDLRVRYNKPCIDLEENNILLGLWPQSIRAQTWKFTANCDINKKCPRTFLDTISFGNYSAKSVLK
jgi:hypothetical protein